MSSDCTVAITDSRATPAYIQYENQRKFVAERKWRCCLNCVNISGLTCKLNGLTIPPDVAVHGCANYDDLPF